MPELPFFPLTPTIKVFPDEPVREEWTRSQFEGFQNETISFQAAFCGTAEYDRRPVVLRAESPLKKQIRIPLGWLRCPGRMITICAQPPGSTLIFCATSGRRIRWPFCGCRRSSGSPSGSMWSRKTNANRASIPWSYAL